MARNVRDIYNFGCYRRLVSITTTCICIMCNIPQKAIGNETKILVKSRNLFKQVLTQVDDNNAENISENFNQLEISLNPFEDGKKFLDSFLKEINSSYGLNLTIHEACQLIRRNLHTLNMSKEVEQVILDVIAMYEIKNRANIQTHKLKNSLMIETEICWPWNWFGLNTKHPTNISTQNIDKISTNQLAISPLCEVDEYPADVYIGAVELLAGALCLVVESSPESCVN